jgi:hypothetical protein
MGFSASMAGLAVAERAIRKLPVAKVRGATRLIVLGEIHLRRILKSYAAHYNEARIHLSPVNDAAVARSIQRFGDFNAVSILGGLTITAVESSYW